MRSLGAFPGRSTSFLSGLVGRCAERRSARPRSGGPGPNGPSAVARATAGKSCPGLLFERLRDDGVGLGEGFEGGQNIGGGLTWGG